MLDLTLNEYLMGEKAEAALLTANMTEHLNEAISLEQVRRVVTSSKLTLRTANTPGEITPKLL